MSFEHRDTPPPPVWISVDIGRVRDWTAISVTERVAPGRFETSYLHRLRPKRYQELIPLLGGMVQQERRPVHVFDGDRYDLEKPRVTLVVDQTGVGMGVTDLIAEAGFDCDLRFVTITGGDMPSHDGDTWRIPKRDLMNRLLVLLENEQLIVAEDLALTDVFLTEMTSIRIKLSATGHDSYGAAGADWRDSAHDDIALSLAMGAYFASVDRGGEFIELPAATVAAMESWFG